MEKLSAFLSPGGLSLVCTGTRHCHNEHFVLPKFKPGHPSGHPGLQSMETAPQ